MVKIQTKKKKKISLVLSGGAALGLAHLGTIKFLEEQNIIPDEIIGSSMGAIIGSFYSLGYSYEECYEFIKKMISVKLFSYAFGNKGLVDLNKIENYFKNEVLKNNTFKDTKIPLKIIATELKTGDKKIFSIKETPNLKIADAVLSSMAVPTIFKPHKINKKEFVDGFLVSNFPIEEAKRKNLIIGVDVINKKSLERLNSKKKYYLIDKFKILLKESNNTFKIMILNQTKEKLKRFEKRTILIEPNLKEFNGLDFKKLDKIIEIGYKETKKTFKKLD